MTSSIPGDTPGDAADVSDPVLHALLPAVSPVESYGRRVVEALRAAGREVTVHALPGPHPRVDPSAILAADIALARLPDGATVLLDAAALPNLAAALPIDDRRLRFVALVERLRWTDAGLGAEEAMTRWHLEQGALALMRIVAVPDAAVAATVAALEVPADRVVELAPEAVGDLLARLSALRPAPSSEAP